MADQVQIDILKKNDIPDLESRIRDGEAFELRLAIQHCNKDTFTFLFEKYRDEEFDLSVLPFLIDCFSGKMLPNYLVALDLLNDDKAEYLQKLIYHVVEISKDNPGIPDVTSARNEYSHLQAAVEALIRKSNVRDFLNSKNLLTFAIRMCPYTHILLLERLALNWLLPSAKTDNALLTALDRSANPKFNKPRDKEDTTTLISWYSPSGERGTGAMGVKPICDDEDSVKESLVRLSSSPMYSDREKGVIIKWLEVPKGPKSHGYSLPK